MARQPNFISLPRKLTAILFCAVAFCCNIARCGQIQADKFGAAAAYKAVKIVSCGIVPPPRAVAYRYGIGYIGHKFSQRFCGDSIVVVCTFRPSQAPASSARISFWRARKSAKSFSVNSVLLLIPPFFYFFDAVNFVSENQQSTFHKPPRYIYLQSDRKTFLPVLTGQKIRYPMKGINFFLSGCCEIIIAHIWQE